MNIERFARLVYERRTELGLTQQEVADAGGPTDTTMTKIEKGEWKPGNRQTTLRKLDVGLQWEAGSALRTLKGGEPTPVGSQPIRAAPPQRTARMGTTDKQRQYQDFRIAELPVIYPLLSRDGQLEVAEHGRRIFNHEYEHHTIGEINELLAQANDGSSSVEGASGETGEGEKTPLADDAESGLLSAVERARAGIADEGFEEQSKGS